MFLRCFCSLIVTRTNLPQSVYGKVVAGNASKDALQTAKNVNARVFAAFYASAASQTICAMR